MTRFKTALAAALLVLLVAGCGQSGPLYLPGNPSKIKVNPPGPVEDERTDEEDDEKGSESLFSPSPP